MTDRPDDIEEVKKSIDKERTNLLTVVAALAFLCITLFVSNISLGAYTVSAINERDAMSIALDDQRRQYHQCVNDFDFTSACDEEMIAPASRDIRRDLEGAGFTEILHRGEREVATPDEVEEEDMQTVRPREAFGLLGYVIYGDY